MSNGRAMLALVSALACAGACPAAATLAKEACDALKAERQRLADAGVVKSMERGPDWARLNLPPAQLQQIGRYIEVAEQITFRCEALKPVDARLDGAESDSEKAAAPAARPARSKSPGPEIGTKPVAPGESAENAAAPKPRPKPRPKPKINDAYVPPPRASDSGLGGLDSQASRIAPATPR